MIMRYFRFRCVQLNDDHVDWGLSWWLTEYGPSGYPNRVIYLYESGIRLRYEEGHYEDEFGAILLMTLEEIIGGGDEEVTKDQFESEWRTGPWLNDEAWAGGSARRKKPRKP
jgi:hypothetical protein